MRTKFFVLLVLSAVLYMLGHYYIGLRLLQSFSPWIGGHSLYYWGVFSTLAGLYLLGRLGSVLLPGKASDKLIWLGSYWLAVAFYLLLFWLTLDCAVLILQFLGLAPEMAPYSPLVGLGVLASAFGLVTYGVRHARHCYVHSYNLAINKRAGALPELRIVMIADIHLGLLVGADRLEEALRIVALLQPDLVLLPGDVLDENIGAFVENEMQAQFRKLKPRFGVYSALGNHEYIWGRADKAVKALMQSGIKVLRDERVLIADSFYLVGRDDQCREQIIGAPRRKLADLVQGRDPRLPLFVMDHQPGAFSESVSCDVDLQLSGHTHHGQFFPINWLTALLFAKDWGYGRQGETHLIVSSGYGTWGPPIRIGTESEILQITVRFSG